MAYKKIKSYKLSEDQLREIWDENYCKHRIITFDGIEVSFYPEMFDHAFFESAAHKSKDKSILSHNRCEKMLWIKDVLEDPEAILKQGWDNELKSHDSSRRVAVVKGNYIVIIKIYRQGRARFITAFEMFDDGNLEKLLAGPDWV
ncbi:MAG: hypothetical protein WBP41_08985 [Saprospiraceae bacterium]